VRLKILVLFALTRSNKICREIMQGKKRKGNRRSKQMLAGGKSRSAGQRSEDEILAVSRGA
jgi:hypothetical protein